MMDQHERHLTEAQLHDAADDASQPTEHAAIEQHLADCASCRADVDRIRSLLDAASALPRDIAPPVDLWSTIQGRIQPHDLDAAISGARPVGTTGGRAPGAARDSARGADVSAPRVVRGGRPWRAYAWLAAAAVLLVLASSAITALVLGRTSATVASGVDSTGGGDDSAGTPAFRTVGEEYERMDRDLAALLAAQRETLAPETVAKVERNLLIIDQAIGEIRQALSEDPNNKALQQLLKASYGQKAALLRQVSQS